MSWRWQLIPCLVLMLVAGQELEREGGTGGEWLLGLTGLLCLVAVVAAARTVFGRLKNSASDVIVEEAV